MNLLKKLFIKINSFLKKEPLTKDELISLIRKSHEKNLLDSEELSMVEGVLQVSELQARDIMIPKSEVEFIDVNDQLSSIVKQVVQNGHSRYPVFQDDRNNISGILLSKDLLSQDNNDITEILRPAVFIPESKRLDILLTDFRKNRNHIAIVVDEYGDVSGILTIEDVLEQIVGDIEDEHDFDETEDNIIKNRHGQYRVKGATPIEDFNKIFKTKFLDETHDTISGLLLAKFSKVPKMGEELVIGKLKFKILRSDSRRIYFILVEKI